MVEIGSHTANERADMVTLHLWDARAQVLPDGGEGHDKCDSNLV